MTCKAALLSDVTFCEQALFKVLKNPELTKDNIFFKFIKTDVIDEHSGSKSSVRRFLSKSGESRKGITA